MQFEQVVSKSAICKMEDTTMNAHSTAAKSSTLIISFESARCRKEREK